jgi:para-aminobenzoate synthetase/4-amino-4-deoxychorismate lyase
MSQSPDDALGLVVLGRPEVSADWQGQGAVFSDPLRILDVRDLQAILPALQELEARAKSGKWVVFMLAYEAAPAFDAALQVKEPEDFPLLWAAVYDAPGKAFPPTSAGWSLGKWTPRTSKEEYEAAFAEIQRQLRAGESYQVNYTMALDAPFSGDAFALYQELTARSGAAYSAYINMGQRRVLSFSPELFFHRKGDHIETRPMKGTAPRGRTKAEDEIVRRKLLESPKERAENVMIVDLLRNDLGKVAVAGGVAVPELYQIETYPGVLQMTSTVSARLKPETSLAHVLGALFPCGSITGAPKVRTMEIIRDLERDARQVYCGAIGCITPAGEVTANVPIRTMLVDAEADRARFWVGGGITVDSTPAGEYEECLTKMRFLSSKRPAFQLLETLLLEDGKLRNPEAHLARMAHSAEYFGYPWDEEKARHVLNDIAEAHKPGRFRVRLLMAAAGDFQCEALSLAGGEKTQPLRLTAAPGHVDSRDVFLFHKTSHRAVYESAMEQYGQGMDDVLLGNERGEITEGCIANIIYKLDGKLWTPPLTCGLLAGVRRGELLASSEVAERVLTWEELPRCEALWLCNSVRGLMEVAELLGYWPRSRQAE